MDESQATHFFDGLRPRLQGIAYRMLGSRAEAEELVQDVWLRWHGAEREGLENAEAWLVTVTTRLAIDRLRSRQAEQAQYTGFWLPEPWLHAQSELSDSPEQQLERADDLSTAFLALLERLSPEARAAYLLREIFDADYAELAEALGKTEAACRQLVHRAKAQLKKERPRQSVTPATHRRLLEGFAEAARSGNFARLQALLAEDAELLSDGGGRVPSFGQVLLGSARIAQLYFAGSRREALGLTQLRFELAPLNGGWGLLRFVDGQLESAHTIESDGERITRIQVQRNPDKLRLLALAVAALRHKDAD